MCTWDELSDMSLDHLLLLQSIVGHYINVKEERERRKSEH
jgi:hypothetical protein